jgi:hypothetical protein
MAAIHRTPPRNGGLFNIIIKFILALPHASSGFTG